MAPNKNHISELSDSDTYLSYRQMRQAKEDQYLINQQLPAPTETKDGRIFSNFDLVGVLDF